MTDARNFGYQIHPLRDAIYDELHMRPFYNLATPQQVTHLVACADAQEQEQAFELVCQLCRRYSVNQPQTGSVAFHQEFGDFTIHWERHVEFYSLTVLQPSTCGDLPFHYTAIDLLPIDWLQKLPGQMVLAIHLIVDDQQLDLSESALCRYFEGHRVIVSQAKKDKAQIFTAFKLHGDGFGRFIIRNQGLSDTQMGQLVRRLLELETYRLLALISLPIAKRIVPQMAEIDQKLADMLKQVNLEDARGEQALLEKLTGIEAQLETYRAETNRRFSATRAYHELVKDRLLSMEEGAVSGFFSIREFMNRRLDPALRTCDSLQRWMDDLSKRIERASDLLRTRVNLNLQEQNRSLLSAMNRRSQLQFRLQETVEGLSIAAISYYMVGLLGYLLNGLPLQRWGLSKSVLLAACIPLVLLLVWTITHRIKHRLLKRSSPSVEH